MDECRIRRMQYRDVKQVAALEKAVFPRPWSEQSFRREVEENPVARYLDNSGLCRGMGRDG